MEEKRRNKERGRKNGKEINGRKNKINETKKDEETRQERKIQR
jgi:hypothetical protein